MLSPCRAGLLGIALLTAPAAGCGGTSTDTGNPPVVIGQKLRLTASAGGVAVSGDPGAVPAGARVDVVNTRTREAVTTTAEPDGSFVVELDGSVTDEYRIYTTLGAESWRTQLTSSGASDPERGLDGLEFLLQASEGFELLETTTLRLAFDDGNLSFSAGCNSHSGSYSLCDGRICVSNLASTNIGCDAPRHDQDEWLAAFFTSSPALEHVGAQLTLSGDEATLEFIDREVADPDRPLSGPTWSIDTLIAGGAASSVPTEASPTVAFGGDGAFEVFTGCNTGNGTYSVSGDTLALSTTAYTDAACGTEAGRSVEDHVTRVFASGQVRFEIDAARLTITRGDLGVAATTQ